MTTYNDTRRRILAGMGVLAFTGIAGCLSEDDDESSDGQPAAETDIPDSEIAESMQVLSIENSEIYMLEVFLNLEADVIVGQLTDSGTHIISNRSWHTEDDSDSSLNPFSDPEEIHKCQLTFPEKFSDGSSVELTMFPDAEEVADRPVEQDIPQGFTFDADPDAAESFDLNIDVTAGSIEVHERDDIPILEEDHQAA